ncbi:MAG TPA: histidine kinase dimerization/phosphoacceptor domain -containing protein [Hanamia sp.]|nr:histidine kinase dimerization/phosphoacceptor domain -containing protein [Hanamia sp.]
MKKIYLLFFFLGQLTYGQKNPYDSLELKLGAEKVDSQKLKLLKQLVDVAFGSDMEKSLEYAKQGVQLSEKIGDKYRLPEFYEMEGRMHANLLHLDSAYEFFNKAVAGYISVGNKIGQATTEFKIAWVYKKKGELDKAMEADLKASALMDSLGDKQGMADAYGRVSEDLTRQGRLTDAMQYAQNAIDICEKNHLENELVYALTYAGGTAIEGGHNQEAYGYFNRALELARTQNFSEVTLCDFLNNRGNALKRLGRYKEAVTDYEGALAKAKKTNYANAISATIANLGEVNLLMGNYNEALPYQLETVNMQERDSDLSNITENYLHLSAIYEHLGDYKSALAYHKKALLIRDSIASVKSDEAMSKMLTQYETQKKEATIKAQQKVISEQREVQWLGGVTFFLMTGFIIFGYISYRGRVKRNRLLASKNAENELLLKEIHHRVKNNLEVVSSLLSLQSAQIDNPETKYAMQESQNRVQSIGIVHQKLYQGKNPGAIEMKDYFLNLSESILDSFGANKRVQIELAMEKIEVDIDTAVPLGLIVNELLTNTLKYAFPNGINGKVFIKLEKREGNILHLEVSDNGIGKSGLTHGTGFGSQLIALLTSQLGGKMREEINNGRRAFFDFKMNKVA